MTLDPARPEKTRRGVWGGVAPPVGLGFGIPPAARVRVRPHYPELPVPGPRRDIGLGQVGSADHKEPRPIPPALPTDTKQTELLISDDIQRCQCLSKCF